MNPKVGMFYIADGEILYDTCELKDAATDGEFFNNRVGHFDFFYNVLIKQKPQYDEEDYDSLQRGRIVYRKSKDIYYVYHTSKVTEEQVKKLIQIFGLPDKKWKYRKDTHYQ